MPGERGRGRERGTINKTHGATASPERLHSACPLSAQHRFHVCSPSHTLTMILPALFLCNPNTQLAYIYIHTHRSIPAYLCVQTKCISLCTHTLSQEIPRDCSDLQDNSIHFNISTLCIAEEYFATFLKCFSRVALTCTCIHSIQVF